MSELPPIPVDDDALTAIEHALLAYFTVDGDGEHHLEGADYQLSTLLDFWAGHSKEEEGTFIGYSGGVPTYEMDGATYHEHDLIAALVSEIRRLRAKVGDDGGDRAGHGDRDTGDRGD